MQRNNTLHKEMYKVETKILTKHPAGKQGVNILKRRYDLIRDTILAVLRDKGDLTFTQLAAESSKRLRGRFDGKVAWYVVTVKLDLEARKVIERVPKTRPQRIKLVQRGNR